jgi:predicted outer membrane protein
MHYIRCSLCIPLLVLLLANAGCSKMKDYESPGPNADRQFVSQLDIVNQNQLKISRPAADAGTQVKGYIETIISYHSSAENDLHAIADSINLELAGGPDSLHQSIATRLHGLAGKQFDTTYLQIQIDDYQKAITYFESELEKGKSEIVIRYAKKHLPIFRDHLRLADSLSQTLR